MLVSLWLTWAVMLTICWCSTLQEKTKTVNYFCIFPLMSLHPYVLVGLLISRLRLFHLQRVIVILLLLVLLLFLPAVPFMSCSSWSSWICWIWCWLPVLIHTFACLWAQDWHTHCVVCLGEVAPPLGHRHTSGSTLSWEKLWMLGSWATQQHFSPTDSEPPRNDVVAPPLVLLCAPLHFHPGRSGMCGHELLNSACCALCRIHVRLQCLTNTETIYLRQRTTSCLPLSPLWAANIWSWVPHAVCNLVSAPFQPRRPKLQINSQVGGHGKHLAWFFRLLHCNSIVASQSLPPGSNDKHFLFALQKPTNLDDWQHPNRGIRGKIHVNLANLNANERELFSSWYLNVIFPSLWKMNERILCGRLHW